MQNEMYDFDLNGNRKKAKIQDKNESYQTGEYNRLLSDENYRYEYDQEGNRISKTNKDNTTTKYFWDHRNRLTKVQTPTESVEYIYDYQNRLVKRNQDKSETHFVHDDWQIILQFENKEIKPTHRYLWGTKQDELISNNNNWTLPDHLNTIRDIVKSDGTVVSHLEYNAFGKLISETKNVSFFFGYTGKLFDKTSELQWNINRWYDANLGRWINEDPITFDAEDTNLVRYVGNTLLQYLDPLGLDQVDTTESYSYNFPDRSWNASLPVSGITFNVGINTSNILGTVSITDECCIESQIFYNTSQDDITPGWRILYSSKRGKKYTIQLSGNVNVTVQAIKRKWAVLGIPGIIGAHAMAEVSLGAVFNSQFSLFFSYTSCKNQTNAVALFPYSIEVNALLTAGTYVRIGSTRDYGVTGTIKGQVTLTGGLSFDASYSNNQLAYNIYSVSLSPHSKGLQASLSYIYLGTTHTKTLTIL